MNTTTHKNCLKHVALLGLVAGVTATVSLNGQVAPKAGTTPAPAEAAQPGKDSSIVTMNPFRVDSDSAGYMISNMTSATRLSTPIDYIPQNVSIVSSSLLRDLNAFEFRDALEYTPGVTQRQNVPDGSVIYGFLNVLRYENGFAPSAGTANYTSDTAFVDRIEIIKGPAAAIAGRSASAGYVNVVTKQPLARNFTNLSATLGSYDYRRAVVDTNHIIYEGNDQSVLFRLVAEATNGDGFRANAILKSTGVYPALVWNLGDNTSFTAEAILLDSTTPSDIGSVYFPGNYAVPAGATPTFDNTKSTWLPLNLDVNEPGQNLVEKPIEIFSTLYHRFNEHISMREGFVYRELTSNQDRATEGQAPIFNGTKQINYGASTLYIDPTSGNLMFARVNNQQITASNSIDNQGDVLGEFNFLGIKTRTDLGYILSKSRTTQSIGIAPMAPLNVFSPQYGTAIPTPALTSNVTNNNGNSWSYFVNNQSMFFKDRLIATVGIRNDLGFTLDQTNNLTGATSHKPATASVLSKMGAMMIRPLPWLGIYGTYSLAGAPTSESLLYPRAPLDYPGQRTLETTPVTLDREFGAKAELLDNRLSMTVTHFDIVQNDSILNEINTSVPGQAENVVLPGISAIGWEWAVNGYVTSHLQVEGGYDYVFTRLPLGKQQYGTPLHKFVMFLNYGFNDYSGDPWHLKLGVISQSGVWGSSGGGASEDLWRVPGATQMDAGIDYTHGGWTFDASIRNLTDVVFPEVAGDQTSNTVNPPREFFVSATRRW